MSDTTTNSIQKSLTFDFAELAQTFSQKKGLVIGDQYLDRNCIGGYQGYSREVESLPIFKIKTERYGPGGAGNLLSNIASLGVPVIAVGVWGDTSDHHRQILEMEFRSRGVDVTGMVVGSRTPTFEKYYFPSTAHVLRLDVDITVIPENSRKEIVQKVQMLSESVDFIVVADYDEGGKGVCSKEVLSAIAAVDVPKFGTSRSRIMDFRGFDTIVINEKELIQTTGDVRTAPEISAALLMVNTGAQNLVVTLGGRGARIYEKRADSIDLRADTPLKTTEIISMSVDGAKIDPCGAGDTFLAVLVSCLVSGVPLTNSVRLANAGARAAVRKLFGASSVGLDEVEREYVYEEKFEAYANTNEPMETAD